LKKSGIPRIEIPTVVNSLSAKTILERLLKFQKRHLQKSQWDYVTRQLSNGSSMLYLSLASRQLAQWSSFSINEVLPSTVKGLTDQIFQVLSINFGSVFVRYALGYITYSTTGIHKKYIGIISYVKFSRG
jgi:hypothetical protein